VLPPRKNPAAPSRFKVVLRQPKPKKPWRLWLIVFALWLLSLLAVAGLAAMQFLPSPETDQEEAARQVTLLQAQLEELRQKQATLEASEQISRAANAEIQATLVERDEEIASLRANIAFYERLVGATAQRRPLSAYSVDFTPEAAGSWHYNVMLTQNLNRGGVSRGQMRFSIEGVKDGKLSTLSWHELHQRENQPGQNFSFRYFQQLNGSIMLPEGFIPQRVRISVSGGESQTFDWKTTDNNNQAITPDPS